MYLINNETLSNSMKSLSVPKAPVAILLKRNMALFSLLNQCFVNNIQYVLLDPSWPQDRLSYVCSNLNFSTLYTSFEYENVFDCDNVVVIDNDAK